MKSKEKKIFNLMHDFITKISVLNIPDQYLINTIESPAFNSGYAVKEAEIAIEARKIIKKMG